MGLKCGSSKYGGLNDKLQKQRTAASCLHVGCKGKDNGCSALCPVVGNRCKSNSVNCTIPSLLSPSTSHISQTPSTLRHRILLFFINHFSVAFNNMYTIINIEFKRNRNIYIIILATLARCILYFKIRQLDLEYFDYYN